MSAAVLRTASTIACTTTFSLFLTVFSFATVHAAQLRWDRSFCTQAICAPKLLAAAQGRSAKPMFGVRAPARGHSL